MAETMVKEQSETGEKSARRRMVSLDSSTAQEINAMKFGDSDETPDDAIGASEEARPQSSVDMRSEQAGKPTNRAELQEGPLGIDIGTSYIMVAEHNCTSVKVMKQLNAFFAIPSSAILKKSLKKDNIAFFDKDDKLFILGNSAEKFAIINGSTIRRPVENGLINSREDEAVAVIQAMLNAIVNKPRVADQKICFSVPGKPVDGNVSSVFHQSVIKMHLQNMGYTPVAVNEGLAVVLSELADSNYTGIGISIGGGMCNVCFSYLSVPVIAFGMQKGGNYIDSMVSDAVGEPVTSIRAYKENGCSLAGVPSGKIETGLHVFYDDLFTQITQVMARVFHESDKIPRMSQPIPIVLSGGSVMPKGSKERFEQAMESIQLPVRISEVRIARNPLSATAEGLLKIATEEETP